MSHRVAICVEDISKSYRIWRTPAAGLRAPALALLAGCLGGGNAVAKRLYEKAAKDFSDFPALKNISFEVEQGECMGIIGRNGSGKSTLLQIVAGTLQPSSGRILVDGRMTALLELGSGFNPDFTGRDNVYLNGSILGIRKAQMDRKFEEIAAFADIGEFIDQPVKTYSSGMVVRLAFAVQVLLDPDVLIVDEALAVGDIFFRQKCYKFMRALMARGVAVLFVTHDLSAVTQFCNRGIVLNRGDCRFIGPADQAVKQYQMMAQEGRSGARPEQGISGTGSFPEAAVGSAREMFWPGENAFLDMAGTKQVSNGWARCTKVALCDETGNRCSVFEQGQTASFFYEIELRHDIQVCSAGVSVQDRTGQIVHVKHSLQQGCMDLPRFVPAGSRLCYRQDVQLKLACGEYTFDVGFFQISNQLFAGGGISCEQFLNNYVRIFETDRLGPFQVVLRKNYPGFQLTHWGLVDLPGTAQCQVISP